MIIAVHWVPGGPNLPPISAQVVTKSPLSGKVTSTRMKMTPDQWFAWRNGTAIQEAFPDLSTVEREMLITGYTADDWATIFAEE